ncbi:MAG TPA: asparagine synthase (glutamine-hydrolyzing) [Candidatus Bathyarchaeia archaeon]|nr:asparagine synthase (glutamine-hydrolyzing) [Candidatus Bathyarchaeia archaeon]
MCGIAGLVSSGRPVSEALVRRMTASLTHRGPDEDGFHVTREVGLGVRRLSIIDVVSSHQPVHNEDRSVWAVFNGEIYNFKSLREELAARGHRFYTQGDSETVVHAYEEWGVDCAAHLRGMFALAVWDEPRRRLLLLRDRIGIKPLYYAAVGDTLLFASEVKALLAVRREHPPGDLDAAALRAFACFGYVPAPLTMWSRIRCLPPGHRLVLESGRAPEVGAYWEVPHGGGALLEDEARAAEEFRALLAGSVHDQMISDVPIGAFLSGGLDSSAVVWRMTESARESVRTFTVGFAEADYDETPWARQVSRRFGSTHKEELIAPEQVAADLVDIVGIFDEPFADSSAIPLHFLSRMTRAQGVTVVLTGDGGDELFGGYETYAAGRLLSAFQRLPSPARALARGAVGLLPVSHGKVTLGEKLRRFMTFSERPGLVAHALWRSIFRPGELSAALADGAPSRLDAALEDGDAAALLLGDLERLPHGAIDVNTLCYLDTRYYLPADMLVKMDRVTMAHSLEARVPLLDERLVDFAFRLSPRLKWRGLRGKWLLRRALRGVVDDAVLARPKAGFNVPMPGWIAGPLRALFRDVLSPGAVARAGAFRPAYVERLFQEHDARAADHSFRLYALLAYHLWDTRWRRAG